MKVAWFVFEGCEKGTLGRVTYSLGKELTQGLFRSPYPGVEWFCGEGNDAYLGLACDLALRVLGTAAPINPSITRNFAEALHQCLQRESSARAMIMTDTDVMTMLILCRPNYKTATEGEANGKH